MTAVAAADSGDVACRAALGQLEVIVGPMFAGKTTRLLRRVQELKAEGQVCVVAKSRTDTRGVPPGDVPLAEDAAAYVSTHDGLTLRAVSASSLTEFRALVGDEAWARTGVVAVDEAQFFPDLVEMCCRWADEDAKHVIVAGLDGDFRRRVFGTSSSTIALVPLADTVTKLLARCEVCTRPAPFTARRSAEDQAPEAAQIRVGGADVYVPLCRHHYLLARDDGAQRVAAATPADP